MKTETSATSPSPVYELEGKLLLSVPKSALPASLRPHLFFCFLSWLVKDGYKVAQDGITGNETVNPMTDSDPGQAKFKTVNSWLGLGWADFTVEHIMISWYCLQEEDAGLSLATRDK